MYVYACMCMHVHIIMSIHIDVLPCGEISMAIFIGMCFIKCVARAVWDFEVQRDFEENSD